MNNFKYLRVFIIFFFIFALSTKLGVSSWNDASRMDTIQSIVEEHSFIIDNSFFETGDKFLYNGHFYSDKPPLLALAVSPIYFFLNIFGITFASHTKLAYYLLTLFSVGLLSALGLTVFRKTLKEFTSASDEWADLTTLITGIGTLVLVYTSVFNNHIFSGVLIFIGFYFLLKHGENGKTVTAVISGLMFSFAGSIDTTCFLFLPFALFLFFRKSLRAGMVFAIACFPPIVIYLLLNLFISGSIVPPPLNATLWNYPGSEFGQSNLSGLAKHPEFSDLLIYAFHMILGNRGLFSHSPVLFYSVIGSILLNKNNKSFGYKVEYGVLLLASLLFVGLGVTSTVNYSGFSFGVRWFASLMLFLCFPIGFIESWVKSSRTKYGFFITVTCLSILIALIGSYSPFTTSAELLSGQAHLVENTIVTGISVLITESTLLGKIRILIVSLVIFFLYFKVMKTLGTISNMEVDKQGI